MEEIKFSNSDIFEMYRVSTNYIYTTVNHVNDIWNEITQNAMNLCDYGINEYLPQVIYMERYVLDRMKYDTSFIKDFCTI